jgi:hypothetical protein
VRVGRGRQRRAADAELGHRERDPGRGGAGGGRGGGQEEGIGGGGGAEDQAEREGGEVVD